ncbi:hypothetical protein BC830DRAFT_513837 [Chytriomyces sp. MP71]|nr:hypothetical protein BC830DRAFT_513837 [Chytriomyces sp. MP71]
MEQNPQFNFHTMSTSSLQRHPSSQPIAPYGMLGMNQIPQSYDSNSQYPPSQLHPQQLYKQRPQQNLSMPRPQQQAQPSQHQASTQLLQYQPAQVIQQQSMTPTQPNMTNMRTVSSSVSNALVPGAISGANDSSRTNSSLPLHVTPTAAVATPQSTTIASRPPDPIASLPKEATDDLLRLFFDYIHPTIPLLHPRSFMAAREGESPLLLHTMFALAARYCDHPAVLALGAMYGGGGAGGAGAATTMEDIRARACDAFYFKARDVVDQYMDFARAQDGFRLRGCIREWL